ncbi:MAG: hypothetical protein ACOYOS_19710, partial [Syntrophales bacterium]
MPIAKDRQQASIHIGIEGDVDNIETMGGCMHFPTYSDHGLETSGLLLYFDSPVKGYFLTSAPSTFR